MTTQRKEKNTKIQRLRHQAEVKITHQSCLQREKDAILLSERPGTTLWISLLPEVGRTPQTCHHRGNVQRSQKRCKVKVSDPIKL